MYGKEYEDFRQARADHAEDQARKRRAIVTRAAEELDPDQLVGLRKDIEAEKRRLAEIRAAEAVVRYHHPRAYPPPAEPGTVRRFGSTLWDALGPLGMRG